MMTEERFLEKLLPIIKMRGWFKFTKERAELTFDMRELFKFDEADLDYAIEQLKTAESIDDLTLCALMVDGRNNRLQSDKDEEWKEFYRELAKERKVMNVCTGQKDCGHCERKYCTLVAKQANVPIQVLTKSITMNSGDRRLYREEFSFEDHAKKMDEEFPGLGFGG